MLSEMVIPRYRVFCCMNIFPGVAVLGILKVYVLVKSMSSHSYRVTFRDIEVHMLTRSSCGARQS